MEKIKIAKTDSESGISFDPEKRPEISNLVLIYSLIHNTDPQTAVKNLTNMNYSSFKSKLAEDMNDYLKPFREKRAELKKDYLKEVLENGRKQVLPVAEETLRLVKEAMKINY